MIQYGARCCTAQHLHSVKQQPQGLNQHPLSAHQAPLVL